jgi:hypothetical protein
VAQTVFQFVQIAQPTMRRDENKRAVVKPHTNKFACFLMPYCYGCPLGTSDCLSADTVYVQRSSSRRSVKFRT